MFLSISYAFCFPCVSSCPGLSVQSRAFPIEMLFDARLRHLRWLQAPAEPAAPGPDLTPDTGAAGAKDDDAVSVTSMSSSKQQVVAAHAGSASMFVVCRSSVASFGARTTPCVGLVCDVFREIGRVCCAEMLAGLHVQAIVHQGLEDQQDQGRRLGGEGRSSALRACVCFRQRMALSQASSSR